MSGYHDGFTEGYEKGVEDTLAKLNAVLAAARYIHHWHDWGRDNEGMVVSSSHVHALWDALAAYESEAK